MFHVCVWSCAYVNVYGLQCLHALQVAASFELNRRIPEAKLGKSTGGSHNDKVMTAFNTYMTVDN